MVGITNKTLIAEIRRQQQLSQSIVEGQTAISTGITLTKPSDNALEKKEMRDQMYSETFENLAKTYLKELRSQAMIEYR